MKNIFSILLLSILMETCSRQTSIFEPDEFLMNNTIESIDTLILDFCCLCSSPAESRKCEYLIENYYDSIPKLSSLVKSHFAHPFSELPGYRVQFGKGRGSESFEHPKVNLVWEELLSSNSTGLMKDRKSADKLVTGCRDYAIFLHQFLNTIVFRSGSFMDMQLI